ncbi:hypothetical protein CONLIGDRAFT_373426 [Coniochaeta ligniaria NRRL 30616]|uniref:Uncharacterized protein n=1 Tax=Coniochaeta ligniaria NRRL 30616 TaxID=1408157 RepID=A0A1J7IL87_9PEZI|nr:hypothetical protein CONLIGDRAFT_373426 [Coniochaeta ligniaria NRRL 30616]
MRSSEAMNFRFPVDLFTLRILKGVRVMCTLLLQLFKPCEARQTTALVLAFSRFTRHASPLIAGIFIGHAAEWLFIFEVVNIYQQGFDMVSIHESGLVFSPPAPARAA